LRDSLRVPAHIAELIRGLHPSIKRKVRAALTAILDDPLRGKALKLELQGLRSLRVGRFRVIYRIADDRVIEVVAVGPRKTIYEETLRLVRRRRG
jgi:mRNA interferase RelE/StbE